METVHFAGNLSGYRLKAHRAEGVSGVTLIWLHGLGASADDFIDLASQYHGQGLAGLEFILPNAPVRPVTVNGGMAMPAWFDWVNPEDPWEGMGPTREDSFQRLEALIQKEVEARPSDRFVIGGFSQGGAIAIETGLRTKAPVQGIFGLSCWCPRREESERSVYLGKPALPIFLAHGTDDPILPLRAGEWSRDTLVAHGHQVTWKDYPMPHSVCSEEVIDLYRWLMQRL
jgi:phospholipase/carboxylesterase